MKNAVGKDDFTRIHSLWKVISIQLSYEVCRMEKRARKNGSKQFLIW